MRAHLKVFSGLAGNHTNAETCSWLEHSVLQTAWCRGKCNQLWETDPGLLSISPQMHATVPLCFAFSILWSNQENPCNKKSVFHFTCVTLFWFKFLPYQILFDINRRTLRSAFYHSGCMVNLYLGEILLLFEARAFSQLFFPHFSILSCLHIFHTQW